LAALAAAIGVGPASCAMRGTWLGGKGGDASVRISLELGSLVHGSVHIPDGLEGNAEVRGTCDPGTRQFVLRGAEGTLAGRLDGSGRALSASWTPALGAAGHAIAMPFVHE
jgi:hypothetical protein